jgi:hypothetical protein
MRRSAVRLARAAWMVWLGTASAACASRTVSELEATPGAWEMGPVALYSYRATDGSHVDGAHMRGRFTVLLFITTFDSASQLMARQLNDILRTHRPRINAAAIVLETPDYAPLAQVFHDSLGLVYPVALADATTLHGQSAFGSIRRVPTLIILNPRGERVWERPGFVPPAVIEQTLDSMTQSYEPSAAP